MARALVALGGNLGDVPSTFRLALKWMGHEGLAVRACSALYGSVAWPDASAPAYTNAAISLHSRRGPYALLRLLKRIERRLGRRPSRQRYASRPIDLDLIAFGKKTMLTQRLKLPHPRLYVRPFVLFPLGDLGDLSAFALEKETARSFFESGKSAEKSILWRKCDDVFNCATR